MNHKRNSMTAHQTELCHGILSLTRQSPVVPASLLHSEKREYIVWSLFFLQVCRERYQSLRFFSVNLQVICSGAFLSGFREQSEARRRNRSHLQNLTNSQLNTCHLWNILKKETWCRSSFPPCNYYLWNHGKQKTSLLRMPWLLKMSRGNLQGVKINNDTLTPLFLLSDARAILLLHVR